MRFDTVFRPGKMRFDICKLYLMRKMRFDTVFQDLWFATVFGKQDQNAILHCIPWGICDRDLTLHSSRRIRFDNVFFLNTVSNRFLFIVWLLWFDIVSPKPTMWFDTVSPKPKMYLTFYRRPILWFDIVSATAYWPKYNVKSLIAQNIKNIIYLFKLCDSRYPHKSA